MPEYTPAVNGVVDFSLQEYTAPADGVVNFDISDAQAVSVNYVQLSIAPNGGKPFKVVPQPISKPVRFQV